MDLRVVIEEYLRVWDNSELVFQALFNALKCKVQVKLLNIDLHINECNFIVIMLHKISNVLFVIVQWYKICLS